MNPSSSLKAGNSDETQVITKEVIYIYHAFISPFFSLHIQPFFFFPLILSLTPSTPSPLTPTLTQPTGVDLAPRQWRRPSPPPVLSTQSFVTVAVTSLFFFPLLTHSDSLSLTHSTNADADANLAHRRHQQQQHPQPLLKRRRRAWLLHRRSRDRRFCSHSQNKVPPHLISSLCCNFQISSFIDKNPLND